MKKVITLVLFICQANSISYAQMVCGFDDINNKLLSTDPQYAKRTKANDEYIRQYVSNHPLSVQQSTAVLYTIPIIIHVVHTGGNTGSIYNPSDAQILGAVDYLNKVYNGTQPGLSGGVGDLQIQFVLAKRDPDCNPTTGIDRVDGSSIPGYTTGGVNRKQSTGATELSVKNLSRWDPANYYNIWIVNKIDGADGTSGQFTAGFAYFPSAPSSLDGAMMLATSMKDGNKVLPHEIGHALNMYHPFQGSSGVGVCPTNVNCSSDGDKVCDTDPISYNANASGVITFTCRTGINSCTGTAYNINTERNFMNYTNCYTLFTAGQKARALAAMTLPSRASLAASATGTPPHEGTQPCPPKINFESNTLNARESTTGIINCTKYTDYTVNMTIASDPTATATATLQLTGTATNPIDYQVTTNGDFTAPSQSVIFPAGSHNNQSFTIRIFDDLVQESPETIIINFTVSNGGGNAVKGVITTMTVIIDDNDYINPVIGSNNYNRFSQPLSSAYQKSRTQAIYLAAELQAMGLKNGSVIAGIGLNVTTKLSSTPYSGFNVKLKHTATANFLSTGFETGTTNVYSNNYSTVEGENLINFTTFFTWNGTSNLLVEFCYENTTASAGSDSIKSTIQKVPNCIWNRTTTGTGCSLSDAFEDISGIGFVRPDLTLVIVKPVATILHTVQTEYLGPNADIYFRSNDSIIARIQNLTDFDYGCTTIEIDRAGTSAANFWNSNVNNYLASKTFKVTPANNNSNSQYAITLYYSSNEINGWQTATGQSYNDIQLVKTDGAISGITPTNPNGSGIVSIVTPIRDTVINGKAVTATFNNGFSGFGAGVLITTTYTFTGIGNWDNPGNWENNAIPPSILPGGSAIIINPANDGECILNLEQRISQGALLNVLPGKKLTVIGNLEVL